MVANGFFIETHNVDDLNPIKAQYQIPAELQACHTAIVDGYLLEGHVPVKEINRLRSEHPAIKGLAVPGMPVGAPGMEVAGAADEAYDVIAFDASGKTQVYASYRP